MYSISGGRSDDELCINGYGCMDGKELDVKRTEKEDVFKVGRYAYLPECPACIGDDLRARTTSSTKEQDFKVCGGFTVIKVRHALFGAKTNAVELDPSRPRNAVGTPHNAPESPQTQAQGWCCHHRTI